MNSFPFAALVLINKLATLRSLGKIEAFNLPRNCVVFFLDGLGGSDWEGQTCGSLAFSAPRFVRNFWLIKQWQQGMATATAMTRTSKFPFRFLYFPRLVSICLRCLCKFSIWIMEKGHFMPLLELWTPHHALPRHGSARLGGNLRRTIVRGGDLA